MSEETRLDAAAARDGSEEAFVRLFDRISPALEAWARVRVRGSALRHVEPSDVVQEVWWRAHRRIAQFDENKANFRSWIFGIAINVLRESMRRRSARGPDELHDRVPIDDLGHELRAQWTSITKKARRSEGVNALADFVGSLEEIEQKLFVHCGLEEMSQADTALLVGLSENAVQKRWARLRERLAEQPRWREFVDAFS